MPQFSFRAATQAAVVLAVAMSGAAALGVEKYTFTPITGPMPISGPVAPAMLNQAGVVAGECQWTNAHGFVFTPGAGSIALTAHPGVIFMGVRGLSEAGQVLFDGCVPPPGGNGACGPYLARYTPGVGNLRLDTLPGGPTDTVYYPVMMNAAGTVAVSTYTPSQLGLSLFVYTDGTGWQNLSNLFPIGNQPQAQLIDLNDAGQVLVWTISNPYTYLYTPGVGVTQALPSAAQATDMNNLGRITGSANFGGSIGMGAFRAWAGGAIENLDPAGTLAGSQGLMINDAGTVAGSWNDGFFLHSDADGLVNVGLVGLADGSHTDAAGIFGMNIRGEFTGTEVGPVYQVVPVIKLVGQPLRRVQDEVDPQMQRIQVLGVTAINDAGQFVVNGVAPGTPNVVSFLETPRPVCAADFNQDGAVGVEDIFTFLAAFFSSDARADRDGASGVTVNDLFAFLAQYFAGCGD